MPPRRQDQGGRKKRAVEGCCQGSFPSCAGCGKQGCVASTPQAPPSATASPQIASPAVAVQAPAQAPAPQASPVAADPGQPPVAERRDGDSPPDVVAELDDDEQLKDAAVGPGVQQVFLQATQKRLKEEVGGRATPLLKPFLDEHDWWLRAVHLTRFAGGLASSASSRRTTGTCTCGCRTCGGGARPCPFASAADPTGEFPPTAGEATTMAAASSP